MRIPVFTLARLHERIGSELLHAVEEVAERGRFLLGPETEAFERELGARYEAEAVAVASGTDALIAALRASGVGPGGEVVVPAMTMAATGIAVLEAGAEPVIVDVRPDDLLLDLESAIAAITPRTRAVLPVHLYGMVQDLSPLLRRCARDGIAVVEDACQSIGGAGLGSRVQGDAAATSFYPTKNLGGWGDGGAVLTRRPEVAGFVRAWRHYGERTRYLTEGPGRNSRVDELQCAVLRRKLTLLDELMEERRAIVAEYRAGLPRSPLVGAPRDRPEDSLHLLPIRVSDRERVRRALADAGIGTGVHYPVPLHHHPGLPNRCPFGAPVAEGAASELMTLPLFPGLRVDEVREVVAAMEAST